jgi:hypothetical protein
MALFGFVFLDNAHTKFWLNNLYYKHLCSFSAFANWLCFSRSTQHVELRTIINLSHSTSSGQALSEVEGLALFFQLPLRSTQHAVRSTRNEKIGFVFSNSHEAAKAQKHIKSKKNQ